MSTFRCDGCGGTFEHREDWTVDKANAEAEANFGIVNASERPGQARVCDACYETIMAQVRN